MTISTAVKSVLVALVLGLFATISRAGYYSVSYTSSGTTIVDWIGGGEEFSAPYLPFNWGYGSVAPTGSIKNSGAIVATMTWVPNPAIPND